MTCREKLKSERPECVSEVHNGGCDACPETYGYLADPPWCIGSDPVNCIKCWDREVPGETVTVYDAAGNPYHTYTSEPIADVVGVKEENGGVTVTTEPYIKDSGNRREFETGAVRDIQEGKGRCDLMPLDVVAEILNADDILHSIWIYKTIGDTTCLYKALIKFCTDKVRGYSRISDAMLEVSKHFEEGAKKYGENNWQKGIPTHCYIDSAVRHYLKFLRGDKDEPHDRAFVWNILCCIWTCKHNPELNDYLKQEKEEEK